MTSRTLRFEVFKRDEFKCQYCGATPPSVVLEADHVIPSSKGGKTDIDNLVTSCFDCNRGKRDRSLKIVPETLEVKHQRMKEKEEQLRSYQKVLARKRKRTEKEQWMVAEILVPGCGERGYKKDDLRSIRYFNERLGVHFVMEAAETAQARGLYSEHATFKFFCAVCWRTIKGDKKP